MRPTIATPVRVRFAPSPTGFLHVGGARTAIYNDLLRQKVGGVFILRIEDTDRERSDEAMTRQIQEALRWLGVPWDEGPHLQSARLERHRERALELASRDLAYRCFCSPEELEARRREVEKTGERFRYPGTCGRFTPEEVAAREAAGQLSVVRFRMPRENVRFHDLVRGEVDFPTDALDDFVLLRSDRSPTYHLSVVVDDIDMEITHAIRGEDHLSNTPKHIALFRAFGVEPPVFGHLPLILGPDRRRLSKRTGATSVEEFREQGILPQALYNYLALLGWNPGDEREIFLRDELIEAFTMERLNDSAAIFDVEKLSWMNGQYLSLLPLDEVLRQLAPFLEPASLGVSSERLAAVPSERLTAVSSERLAAVSTERLAAAVDLHRGRVRTLRELAAVLPPYFAERLPYDPESCRKYLADAELPGRLEHLGGRWSRLERWEKDLLEAALRESAEELGVKAGALIHPVRMALTGEPAGPPLFDLVEVMGREPTARHLANFIGFLKEALVAKS